MTTLPTSVDWTMGKVCPYTRTNILSNIFNILNFCVCDHIRGWCDWAHWALENNFFQISIGYNSLDKNLLVQLNHKNGIQKGQTTLVVRSKQIPSFFSYCKRLLHLTELLPLLATLASGYGSFDLLNLPLVVHTDFQCSGWCIVHVHSLMFSLPNNWEYCSF